MCEAVLAKEDKVVLLAAHHVVKVDFVAHGEKLLLQLAVAEGVLALKPPEHLRVDRHPLSLFEAESLRMICAALLHFCHPVIPDVTFGIILTVEQGFDSLGKHLDPGSSGEGNGRDSILYSRQASIFFVDITATVESDRHRAMF